jgi:uncharacterized protein (TIGR03435 family)
MLLTAAVLCALTLTGAAQQARPRFEVASIRPVSPSATFRGSPLNIRRDTFSATNHSVLQLIRVAYGVLERQILDGPGWIRSERFSVTAKTSTDVPRDQALRMLQTLLEDRFKLRVRQETREMPILELRLARSDGRVGRIFTIARIRRREAVHRAQSLRLLEARLFLLIVEPASRIWWIWRHAS